jgi:cold shock CspA family protein
MKGKDVFYGEVGFWNGNSYGFIRPDRGGDDVFFYVDELLLPEGPQIKRGDRVVFDIDNDTFKPGKQRAVCVRLNGDETK